MGNLIFNGISSEDLGVVIQTSPVYEFPSKKVINTQITGKNGSVITDTNAYDNVSREYNIAAVFREGSSHIDTARVITDWLNSANGYARLEDSYEPSYFRKAVFNSGGQLPNYYDLATGMSLKFECMPQRFLKSGDIPISFNGHDINKYYSITNDTKYISLPELTISGRIISIEILGGDDVLNPSHRSMITTLSGAFSDSDIFIIDSELQDAYTSEKYVNDKLAMDGGFPKLYPGSNWIKITYANINASVDIKTRTWVL